MKYLYLALGLMNLIAFSLMGLDKRRARLHQWRIPERTLFAFAILGGGIGASLGMWLFHHKTRHWYFAYGFPFFAISQIGLFLWFFVF